MILSLVPSSHNKEPSPSFLNLSFSSSSFVLWKKTRSLSLFSLSCYIFQLGHHKWPLISYSNHELHGFSKSKIPFLSYRQLFVCGGYDIWWWSVITSLRHGHWRLFKCFLLLPWFWSIWRYHFVIFHCWKTVTIAEILLLLNWAAKSLSITFCLLMSNGQKVYAARVEINGITWVFSCRFPLTFFN
jgi:hypothetical protein